MERKTKHRRPPVLLSEPPETGERVRATDTTSERIVFTPRIVVPVEVIKGFRVIGLR